jgi:aerobic C4-dicarboxylate transport protein
MEGLASRPVPAPRRPWYTILYVQVLIAIAVGIVIGYVNPDLGK